MAAELRAVVPHVAAGTGAVMAEAVMEGVDAEAVVAAEEINVA